MGSDQPGEVVAAATAIHGILKKAGCDFHDLVAVIESPPPAASQDTDSDEPDRAKIQMMAEFCSRHAAVLTEKERSFVLQMQRNAALGWRISKKQGDWLESIYIKLRRFS